MFSNSTLNRLKYDMVIEYAVVLASYMIKRDGCAVALVSNRVIATTAVTGGNLRQLWQKIVITRNLMEKNHC